MCNGSTTDSDSVCWGSSKQPKREAGRTVKSRALQIISGTAKGGRNNAGTEYPVKKVYIAELCNGSTTESDSVCWGSNPYSAANEKASTFRLVLFLVIIQQGFEQGGSVAEENSPVDCFRRRGQAAIGGAKGALHPKISLFRCQNK